MRIKKYDTRLNEDRLPYLVKESAINYKASDPMSTPRAIVEYLNKTEDYENLTNEVVFMMCFDTKIKLIGTFEVSKGSVDRSVISTRDIFMKALALGAVSIILVHNHPTGDPTFSNADIAVAKAIKEAGDLLGIKLFDFICVGVHGKYQSVRDQNIPIG